MDEWALSLELLLYNRLINIELIKALNEIPLAAVRHGYNNIRIVGSESLARG